MKLPLSWLAEFVTVEAPLEQLCERLTVAGLEVESIDHIAPSFTEVFVAKVIAVERHPNADRLNLCDVDAGRLAAIADEFGIAGRTAAFEEIEAPLLSAANWGGMGLHTRGNFEGFVQAGSKQKWLEAHGDTHFTHFYSNYGETLQKRFFGHFLKGADTGWDKQPRVSLNVRHPHETFVLRAENEWPLARTQWTKYFLRPDGLALSSQAPAATAKLVS